MTGRVPRWWWAAGAPLRWGEIVLIRLYRATLSGAFGGGCRFHPSCSEYAEHAIREAGALRGSLLAAWRLLRCSPLSRGGVDYPPRRPPLYDANIHRARRGSPEAVP